MLKHNIIDKMDYIVVYVFVEKHANMHSMVCCFSQRNC
jgi:hypothetical protein